MRIPDYPSNREADEGTIPLPYRREGAPEEEAKSGDLFTRECSWDGAKLYGIRDRFSGCSSQWEGAAFLSCLFENPIKRRKKP